MSIERTSYKITILFLKKIQYLERVLNVINIVLAAKLPKDL